MYWILCGLMEFLIFDFEGHSNIYRFYLCDGSFFFLFLAFDLYLQKITFQKYFVYELQPLYSVHWHSEFLFCTIDMSFCKWISIYWHLKIQSSKIVQIQYFYLHFKSTITYIRISSSKKWHGTMIWPIHWN